MIVIKVVESGGKCHEVVEMNHISMLETAHHIRKLVKHNVYGDI